MAIRVFADANILIAGADSRTGASNAVLKMAEVGLYCLVASHQVLDEAERNLRKKLPRALINFATQMGQLILEIVPNPPKEESAKWEKIIEAKDAPILAAAVIAQVDCLVTLNTKDFTPYVAEQSGLLIQTPSEFVREIRSIVNAQFGRSS